MAEIYDGNDLSYDAAEQADRPAVTDSKGRPVDPCRSYAVFYVDNLRTRSGHYTAMVSGEQAVAMHARSSDPRRLVFSRA